MNVLTATGMQSSKLLNEHGGFNRVSRWDKLGDDIRVLLMTSKGTQIGDPEFGSNLFKMIYRPASKENANIMRSEIQDCINTYYPDISIQSIDISFYDNEVFFDIAYSIQNTNTYNKIALQFIKSNQYLF